MVRHRRPVLAPEDRRLRQHPAVTDALRQQQLQLVRDVGGRRRQRLAGRRDQARVHVLECKGGCRTNDDQAEQDKGPQSASRLAECAIHGRRPDWLRDHGD
jgi:hypothetical protein